MEPLIRPMESIEYELSYKIITNMFNSGIISKDEFNKIDILNRETFIRNSTSKTTDLA